MVYTLYDEGISEGWPGFGIPLTITIENFYPLRISHNINYSYGAPNTSLRIPTQFTIFIFYIYSF